MRSVHGFLVLVIVGLLAALFLKPSVLAKDDSWLTDFEMAKKVAATRKVPILVDFSGSDWCGWCMKLDREVLSQPAFAEYAKENLVLLFVDFPMTQPQSEDLKRQNQFLAEQYGVQGFPTILLLDAEGKVIGRTGYQPGGAEKYVAHIQELLKAAPAGEKKAQDAAGK